MERRRGASRRNVSPDVGSTNEESASMTDASESPVVELRKPRHGGWKGRDKVTREAALLRGEPGYHIGLFRIAYGALLVQRTLVFMSSGAVDASFSAGDQGPPSPGQVSPQQPSSVFNFGHGFLLLGNLASPSADAVRSACWCLCGAGAALSVGHRSNAVAFAAAVLQMCLLLLEKSVYSDEAYLFALVGLLLSFTHCGKTIGVDTNKPAEGGADRGATPALRDQPADIVPHWHVVLLRFQFCIVHIHRGLAKAATGDWLLGGQPLLHTLERMPETQFLRRAAEWLAGNGTLGFGGGDLKALAVRANGTMIFLDLFLGVSLLAAPHYRPVALVLQTAVHLGSAVFGPADARTWHLLIAATVVLYLDPAAIKKYIERVQEWLQPAVSYDDPGRSSRRGGRGRGAGARGQGKAADGSRDGERVSSGSRDSRHASIAPPVAEQARKRYPLQPKPNNAIAALIFAHVLAQVLLPVRHLLGVFSVEWSREGHEFSWRSGGGVGSRAGSGGLVREEALVRITHRPRAAGQADGKGSGPLQMVHLYGAPLTSQQVVRMVLDPDMLLQLTKKSAETSPAADGGKPRRSRGGPSGRQGSRGADKRPRVPPLSNVDAWKSINGRPFSRWIDPSVDVWDSRFGNEGPSNAEWLEMPPLDAELDRAADVMEAISSKWALRGQSVTFFAARAGQAGLSNVFLGGYDPSNLNTTDLCAVPPQPAPAASSGHASTGDEERPAEESGGILLGVAMGEVQLLTDPGGASGSETESEAEARVLKVSTGAVAAPMGRGHSVRAGSEHGRGVAVGKRAGDGRRGALAVWYYVHACPSGMFHLCIGFLSGAGWELLYPPALGARKGWTMQHGVPKP